MAVATDALKIPTRTKELTRSHFEFLAEIVRDDLKDRRIDLKDGIPRAVFYTNPQRIPLELLEAGLISRDPNIKGLFRPTALGKKIIENYPTFYVLMRREDASFEQISTTIAKGARRIDG